MLPDTWDMEKCSWVCYAVAALIVVIGTIIAYYVSCRLYEQKTKKSLRRSNAQLSLILNTSKVDIWLFDIPGRTITSIDTEGKKSVIPLSPDIEQHYIVPEDYERLCNLLDEIASRKKERETIELKVIRREDKELCIFSTNLSVLKRDRSGQPLVIIGATTDITAQRKQQRQQRDDMLRYQYIFNTALVDTVSYDEHGFIDDMNQKATKGIGGGLQSIVDAHISVQSVLGNPDLSLDDLDYTYLTQIYKRPDDERPLNKILKRDELYYELQLVPIREDDGRLLGIYGTGRDVTEVAKSYSRLRNKVAILQKATGELQDYTSNIDYVMKNGNVRIVNYSPDTHTLTVYSEIEHVQHQLTQTRLVSLTDSESRRTALRIMKNMDNGTPQTVKAVIKTVIRIKGRPLWLALSFVPVKDANGRVTGYFGMIRDISDFKATEELLAKETKKAQEVETVKDAFLRNMCYEIRTPLNCVVGFAELIEQTPPAEDEKVFIEEIKKNARSLLNVVNNILFLSRLDAGMIEFRPEPVDFPVYFEDRCRSVWENCQQPGVDLILDIPYDHLTLNIDLTNLGVVIDQIVTDAAQNTTSGHIKARFDYNGEDLTVTIQDTGCGIPADHLDTIFERFVTTHSGYSGLGLPICQEVVRLMGGRIHIKSEVDKGTIFWIIIPCSTNP